MAFEDGDKAGFGAIVVDVEKHSWMEVMESSSSV